MVSTTTTPVPSRLAADAAALADGVVPLSSAAAAAFLEAHPLPAIVEQLQAAPPQVAGVVARALEKVLATETGSALLPSLLEEGGGPVAAATAAASPALRSLAAAVLARALPVDPSRAAPRLVALLTDADASVAGAAEAALLKAARAGGGGGAALLESGALAAPLSSPDATVRARGLAVSAALLSSSDPAVSAAARAAGVLAPLAAELDGGDPLTAAAALAAVAAAAEGEGEASVGAASALLDALGGALAAIIDRGNALFAPVWAQALNTAAVLLAAAAAAGGGQRAAPTPVASSLTAALDAHLSESSTEDDPVREGAAVEAAGSLGATSAGAALLAGAAPRALAGLAARALGARGAGGGTAARVAALHALASISGAERVRPSHPQAALLSGTGAEAGLAAAVHAGAAEGRPAGTPPAAAFAALTAQPLDDVRVAALRALLPLVAARPWAAADAAASPELLARLTAARPWAGSPPAEWRHAVVLALERSARAALSATGDDGLAPQQRAALAAALPALVSAARAGAHGFGARDMVAQEVATRAG